MGLLNFFQSNNSNNTVDNVKLIEMKKDSTYEKMLKDFESQILEGGRALMMLDETSSRNSPLVKKVNKMYHDLVTLIQVGCYIYAPVYSTTPTLNGIRYEVGGLGFRGMVLYTSPENYAIPSDYSVMKRYKFMDVINFMLDNDHIVEGFVLNPAGRYQLVCDGSTIRTVWNTGYLI